MISWPRLVPGEIQSPARFGAWQTPAQLESLGYWPWQVLDPSGLPWSWGFVKNPLVAAVLEPFNFTVPADRLLDLESRLRLALGGNGWRSERFGLVGAQGDRSNHRQLALERSLFRPLGLLSESVQLNLQADASRWWIARRAMTKAVDPGLLDACVAGGLPAGEAPVLCLFREAVEEAGLGADITSQARLQGVVRVFRPLPEGLLIERVWTFSLRAPAGVTPSPSDGEVSAFERLTLEEIDRAWAAGGFNHEAAVASLCF